MRMRSRQVFSIIFFGIVVIALCCKEQSIKSLRVEPPMNTRRPAGQTGTIEIIEKSLKELGIERAKSDQGLIKLDLDEDTLAYFDGSSEAVFAYRLHDAVWLGPGVHTVTVIKPSYPPVMARFHVWPGFAAILAWRIQ